MAAAKAAAAERSRLEEGKVEAERARVAAERKAAEEARLADEARAKARASQEQRQVLEARVMHLTLTVSSTEP